MGGEHARRGEDRMKPDKPWVPSFGMLLFRIAIMTHDIAPKAVPSLYVIIVALILSLVVAGAGGAYAMSGRRANSPSQPPSYH
jgi:hypothetical protein